MNLSVVNILIIENNFVVVRFSFIFLVYKGIKINNRYCLKTTTQIKMPVRFKHINLITKDWKRLASFYEEVLGCIPVKPERDLSGEWLDNATGIKKSHIKGIHLRLPGCGQTLEIFQYENSPDRPKTVLNSLGFSHIAFIVDDVAEKAREICNAGGKVVGELAEVEIPEVGFLGFQYLSDPDGNIIELQKWLK